MIYPVRKITNLRFFFFFLSPPNFDCDFAFIIPFHYLFCHYKHLLNSSSLTPNIKVSCRNIILEIFWNGVSCFFWLPRLISVGMGSVFPTHPTSNSQTPVGCPMIQLNSDTISPERASDSIGNNSVS